MPPASRRSPKIGLVLGSGSARGWAHLGVLKALQEAGVRPDIVCGSSVGALIAAVYAAKEIDRFTDWILALDRSKIFQFMDFRWSGGILKGDRLMKSMQHYFGRTTIEECQLPFAAVSTDLYTGAEVWLRRGPLVDAVRASIALPGLFTPVATQGRWLVDGGLVNPVPVSVARALGADVVIAVDLNADIMRRRQALPVVDAEETAATPSSWLSRWHPLRFEKTAEEESLPAVAASTAQMPSVLDVGLNSINIMQMRISRSRLAGDPPEVLITPRLAHLGLLDFHRAEEAIAAGHHAALLQLPELANFY